MHELFGDHIFGKTSMPTVIIIIDIPPLFTKQTKSDKLSLP